VLDPLKKIKRNRKLLKLS